MTDIFDYDGPAYVSAFAEIMERIEYIQNNEVDASRKEKKLLNSFYNHINQSRSANRSVSRSVTKSRSASKSKSRSKSTKKNRNKIGRKKKTIKRKY
jgi:hypothetical protein